MIYIYGLVCPDTGQVRYIGKSENPKKRLRAHVSASLRNTYDHHTARWIRKLHLGGKRPSLKILEMVLDCEDWREVERSWIAKAKNEGWPLTNTTAGGEGLDYLDKADEARWRENWERSMRAYRSTSRYQIQLREFLEASQTPEAKKHRRCSLRKTWAQPGRIENLREAICEAQNRPEVKGRKSASVKAYWAANRSKLLEKMHTPEARERHRKSRVAAWADPEVGAKLRAIHASPEVRAKKSEGAKRRSTPEYRAMMAERTRLSWEKRRNQTGA